MRRALFNTDLRDGQVDGLPDAIPLQKEPQDVGVLILKIVHSGMSVNTYFLKRNTLLHTRTTI